MSTLTTLFSFSGNTHYGAFFVTAFKMKYLTALTTVFFLTKYTHYAVLLYYYYNEISDNTNYAVFLH